MFVDMTPAASEEINAFDRVRQRVFQLVLALGFVLSGIAGIAQIITDEGGGMSGANVFFRLVFMGFAAFGLYLITINKYVFAITQTALLLFLPLILGRPEPFLFVVSGLILVVTISIFGHDLVFLIGISAFMARLFLLSRETEDGLTSYEAIFAAVVILLSAFILRYFTNHVRATVNSASRNNRLLRVTSEIGQIITTLTDLDDVFGQSVKLISERFGYYHVQVFLVDKETNYAKLVASTGDVGQKLIARGHQLAVGSRSVIGRVTQFGELVVARDADTSEVHSRNELLPDTRAELALPIIDGNQIIGALDLQSTRGNDFDEIDIQALQAVVSQLGIAARNARLFQDQVASVQQNQRLLQESQANLGEIERLNRQLTRDAWRDYLSTVERGSGITVAGGRLTNTADWTPLMSAASQDQKPVRQGKTITVPIMLRGAVLGALEIEPGDDVRLDDATEIVQAVADRLAVGLENNRLYEEAQQTTAQEQRINEIVGAFQQADSVDSLLQITLRELAESLGASSSKIRLIGNKARQASTGSRDAANGHLPSGDPAQ